MRTGLPSSSRAAFLLLFLLLGLLAYHPVSSLTPQEQQARSERRAERLALATAPLIDSALLICPATAVYALRNDECLVENHEVCEAVCDPLNITLTCVNTTTALETPCGMDPPDGVPMCQSVDDADLKSSCPYCESVVEQSTCPVGLNCTVTTDPVNCSWRCVCPTSTSRCTYTKSPPACEAQGAASLESNTASAVTVSASSRSSMLLLLPVALVIWIG